MSMLDKMLANFDLKFTDDMKDRAKEMGMSVDEIVTMASVVEREAAIKNEFDIVAGVFYNRINCVGESRGYLESCATVQYILGERKTVLSVADTKIDSGYNTYMYSGLPEGPIASPGMLAIKAALYPKDTEYLYFVADGSGRHLFAKDFNTHQQNMKKAASTQTDPGRASRFLRGSATDSTSSSCSEPCIFFHTGRVIIINIASAN